MAQSIGVATSPMRGNRDAWVARRTQEILRMTRPLVYQGAAVSPESARAQAEAEYDYPGDQNSSDPTTPQVRAAIDRQQEIEAAQRAAALQASLRGGVGESGPPGGVPWTKTEMEAGLSGAPRSDIPLDAELTVTRSKPLPVDISSVAPDHGLTRVDSGDIERDPVTGKARPGGAWAVAAPRPQMDFVDDETDERGIAEFEDKASVYQDPNARRRADLERAGYQVVRKQRPDGSEVWVYSTRDQGSPVDSERRDMAWRGVNGRQMSEGMSGGTEFQREARIQRMADKLGKTPEEIEAMLAEGGEKARGDTPGANEIGYNSFAAFKPVRRAIATQRGAEKKARAESAQAAVVRNAQWRQNLQEWFNNPTVTEEQRQLASAILLRRGDTPNDVDSAQAEGFQRGLLASARQNLNVNNSELQAAQAEAARAEVDKRRREDRAPNESNLADKYAPNQPWYLGGGYDEFTEDEQWNMYDDLVSQGYSDVEAQRAVDQQAANRRASARANWRAGRPKGRAAKTSPTSQPQRTGPGNLPVAPSATPYRTGA